jgi:hypothetical protein
MAVPSSGELSLQAIANEMLQDDYNAANGYTNVSLGDMGSGTAPYSINTSSASYPNSAAPHGMAEFYSYDNDASSATSYSGSVKGASYNACFFPNNTTYYHNGSGALPAVGDNVFSDVSLSTAIAGGWYRAGTIRIEIKTDLTFPTPIHTGEVLSVVLC